MPQLPDLFEHVNPSGSAGGIDVFILLHMRSGAEKPSRSMHSSSARLAEPDKQKQAGYLALIRLARRALEECIDLLGFSAPASS